MASSSALSFAKPALPSRPALRRPVVLDMVLPFVAVMFLQRNGVALLTAYAAASLFPAASVIVSWLD
jgi:hypothetical protein